MTVHPTALPEGLPRPEATDLDRPYWTGLRERRLVVQRCVPCRSWRFGPEHLCPFCQSFHYDWEEVEASGLIYSWERVWHPVHPALDGATPYVVVLVEIPKAGGVRMIGNLLGDPRAPVAIGQPVAGVFEDHASYTLLQWKIA